MEGSTSAAMDWLETMEEATACLREKNASLLDPCLGYLMELERILSARKKKHWDRPPGTTPPVWKHYLETVAAVAVSTREALPTVTSEPLGRSNNIYDSLQIGELSNGESDEDESDEGKSDDDDEEAGDLPTMNISGHLDIRRLLIRILTCQSETFAAKAMSLRQSQDWKDGAAHLTYSLQKIHLALTLADSEISKWSMLGQEARDLMQDANIVEIAICSLTTERERYLSLAQQQEAYLLRKLEPQWESRDSVKQRMGDRWTNNPHPKQDYAKIRRDQEELLKEIRAALQYLLSMDMAQAELSSKELQDRLRVLSQRYNGLRPVDVSRRVDWVRYPDATELGWIFTGSWDVAEFFEKDGVKLDWYFTTGTVKTAMDHPTQGRTQLFAAKVDPQMYMSILENPRVHTGQRYHKTNQKNGNKAK
jgi:hypothetical protein